MVTEELLRYVEFQINRGVDRNSIKMTLLQNGWTGNDITEAFKVVDTVLAETPPAISNSDSTNPNQVSGDQTGTLESGENLEQSRTQPVANQVNDVAIENQARVEPNSEQPVNVIEDIKYRKPSDWQQAPDEGLVSAFNQNLQSDKMPSVNNEENQSRPNALNQSVNQTNNTVTNVGSGSVVRPRISENYFAEQAVKQNQPSAESRATNPSTAVQNPIAINSNPASSHSAVLQTNNAVADNMVKSNPAAQLKEQTRKASNSNRPKVIKGLLVIILLILLGAGGYYYFINQTTDQSESFQAAINTMVSQEYIQYEVNGALPVIESQDLSPAFAFASGNQFSFVLKGLINPATSKNVFSVGVDPVVFDYVYDGAGSYGRLRQLPPSFQTNNPDVTNAWFNFSDAADTRSVLQIFANNPATSLPTVGSSLKTALRDLYLNNLVTITTGDTSEQTVRKSDQPVETFQAETIGFSFEVAQLSARLGGESDMLLELLANTGVMTVSGTAFVDQASGLVRKVDLNLITINQSYPVTIELFYDYASESIGTPSNIIDINEVMTVIKSLTSGNEVDNIRNQIRLIGSTASVYFDTNGNFNNLCEQEDVARITNELNQAYNLTASCAAEATSFGYQVPLPAPGFYSCIDTDYVETTTATAFAVSPVRCGDTVAYKPVEPAVVPATAEETSPAETNDEFFE